MNQPEFPPRGPVVQCDISRRREWPIRSEVQLEGAHFINDGRLTCKFGDLTVPVWELRVSHKGAVSLIHLITEFRPSPPHSSAQTSLHLKMFLNLHYII